MKQKAVIYPYIEEWKSILEYFGRCKQYEINAIFAPIGWGHIGEEINIGQKKYLVRDEDRFLEVAVGEADILIVPDFLITERLCAYIVKVLKGQIGKYKKVLCFADIGEKYLRELNIICQSNNVQFEQKSYNHLNQEKKPLKSIPVPIVALMGCWENTDKFLITLKLVKEFEERGFNVLTIGAGAVSELLEFHKFPWEIVQSKISETEKVYALNEFICKLVYQKKPDVVIFDIPGPIQGINWDYPGEFGIIPYMVSQAITIDYLIVASFYIQNGGELLKELSKMCLYRFGKEANVFHMSKLQVNLSQTLTEAVFKNGCIDNTVFKDEIKEMLGSVPVVDLTIEREERKVVDDIIEMLS